MKYIIIPVEVKSREFASRLLLSCFAAEEGYKVIFGSQSSINRNIDFIPKGVIFDKSISKNKYKTLKSRVENGFKIVSLDEEGLASHDNKFVYLNQRISSKTLKIASMVFTWGKDEAELITENYPKYKNKIKIVGNPRIEIWHSKFKNIYKNQALEYKKKFGKYILLPSNFVTKHAKGEFFLIKQAWELGKIKNKKEEKEFISIQKYKKKSFNSHVNLIKRLANEFKNITMVIRPHPSEDLNAWDEVKNLPNVKIIFEGSITPWLLGSKMSIHNNCTTGLEAYLLGKPVISYKPYSHPEYGKHISNGVSLRAKTEEEVINHVKNILNDSDYFKNNLKIWPIFKDIISISENKLACEKIVEELNSLDWPESKKDQFSIPYLKEFIINSMDYTKKILSKSDVFKEKYAYTFQKFPGSSLEEIEELIKEYQRISGKFKNVRVKKLTHDLYLIYKE